MLSFIVSVDTVTFLIKPHQLHLLSSSLFPQIPFQDLKEDL